MHSSDRVVQVTAVRDADGVLQAAAIWARAKAWRDRDPEPTPAEAAVPGIRRRLALDGATLLLARRGGRPVGFTLFAPRARTLEVFYLGVDPNVWGSGVGRQLLLGVDDRARKIGREALELWVIDDNERAIRLYERSGWVSTDDVKRGTPAGRLERRFVRHLPPGSLDLGCGSGEETWALLQAGWRVRVNL